MAILSQGTKGIASHSANKNNPHDVSLEQLIAGSKGEIIVHDGSDMVTLPIAADGTVLTLNSATATGLEWVVGGGGGVTDHTLLSNIGTNSHAQLDLHIADTSLHYTQASISITESQVSDLGTYLSDLTGSGIATLSDVSAAVPTNGQVLTYNNGTGLYEPGTPSTVNALNDITDVVLTGSISGQVLEFDGTDWVNATPASGVTDHTLLSNIGTNSHAQLDLHIASTSNPHSVSQSDIGLGMVDNTPDLTKPVSILQQGAIDSKLDDVVLTAGELITYNGVNNIALPVGADNLVLAADSSEATGLRWVTNAGGGGGGADLNTPNEWTGTQNFNQTALTDAPVIAWNASINQVTSVTLTADRTLGLPINLVQGALYTLLVIQDATGARQLSYNDIYMFTDGRFPNIDTQPLATTVMTFSYDGSNMLLINSRANFTIGEFYQLAFAEHTNVSFNSAPISSERGSMWSNDGLTFYIVCESPADRIYQFTATIPFVLSSVNTTSTAFLNIPEDTQPEGIAMDPTDTVLFMLGDNGNDITQYDLTVPGDITTGVFQTQTALTGLSSPRGFGMSADGTLCIVGQSTTLFQFDLSTPWDISTMTYSGDSFNTVNAVDGIAIHPDKDRIFVVSSGPDAVSEYSLPTPGSIVGMTTTGVSFNVASEATTPNDLQFSPSGHKFYITQNAGATYEYDAK